MKLSVRLYGKGVCAKINDRGGSDATKYYKRKKGQLIFSKLDFLNGAFGLIPPELDGYESTLDLPCFDIAPTVDPDWLLAVVARPAFYRRYRGVAIGSRKAQRVPVDEFLASVITLPPTQEQRQIAEVLRGLQRTIDDTQKCVASLRRTKYWTMRVLLTEGLLASRKKLVPIDEPWPMGRISSTVDRRPSHWKLVALTSVAKLESGHTPSRQHPEYWNGDIPWLSLGDTAELRELKVMKTSECVTQAGIDNSSARLLPTDTVVLSRTAVRGLCSRLGKPMATSQDFVGFVCGANLRPDYLTQLFRHMQREWRRLEQGSSPTNKTLYFSVFEGMKILLPPMEEQAAIAEVGESFDLRILAEERYLDHLRATKRGVAQALLSGRVRVPATPPKAATAAKVARKRQ